MALADLPDTAIKNKMLLPRQMLHSALGGGSGLSLCKMNERSHIIARAVCAGSG